MDEYEFYGQDQWRVKPNFTFTYGLRYSILQPPYETTGTQVSPTSLSLNDWFSQRSIAAANGQVYDPMIGFGLLRPGQRQAALLGLRLQRLCPSDRLRLFSPGRERLVQGGYGLGRGNTSIRAGYGHLLRSLRGRNRQHIRPRRLVRIHYGRNKSGWNSNRGRLRPIFGTVRASQPTTTTAALPPPCSLDRRTHLPARSRFMHLPAPRLPGGFAITWGLDDKLLTLLLPSHRFLDHPRVALEFCSS